MNQFLERYYRKPQVWISIPTNGKFYNSGCKLSLDDQLSVKAMTASDEIMLKNPEALLNGEAIINLVKSCCPDITNSSEIFLVDLDVILIAIRHATYGENLEFTSKCTNCENTNNIQIHFSQFISNLNFMDKDPSVKINEDIIIKMQPTRYIDTQRSAQKEFEYASLLKAFGNSPNQEQKEKIEEAKKQTEFSKISLITESIRYIETPEGNVEDRNDINDFVFNLDSISYKKIFNNLEKLNDSNVKRQYDITCSSCNQTYNQQVNFDNSTFFV